MVSEAGGEYSFKEFSDMTEKADGAVACGVMGIFARFMDHCDNCCFPG